MIGQLHIAVGALLLIGFVVLIYYFAYRIRNGYTPNLRRIQGYERLKTLSGRAIENGRTLHLSLGVGGMADNTTADSLAGLTVLNYLANKAAITGISPTVSMADPMVMLYSQNVLRTAHANDPDSAQEAYRHIRWVAPQSTAYAAGVMNLLTIDRAEANVMIGQFGDEYLLMGEVAARQNVTHIGGTSNPNTLPFIYASADETLIGEEMYAAGAYLTKRSSHVASLLAQDTLRWLIVIVIFGGIILSSYR